MSQVSWCLKAAAVIVLAAGFTIGHAADDDAYVVTPLVSNLAGAAPKGAGVLQNAWGIAFRAAGRMGSASTFHLSFGYHVHKLNASQKDPGTTKSFESQHGR